ncbi:hypothetical protein SLE2022_324020 [Rubroshorea leprosula]
MAEHNDIKFDSKRKPPLFPANFVTILQLKERWSREQERKQREKEEEDRQKKVVEGEEAGGQKVKREVINCRNQSRRYDRRDRSRGHETLESAVKEAESEGLKNQKKEKSMEWREKSKKKDEEVIAGEEEAPPSQTFVEKDKVPTRREWRPRGAPTHFRPSIQNATVEIGKKIGGPSVNGANRRDCRYSTHTGYYDRSNLEYGRDYGRFHRPVERKSRNAGMMWVKKGEVGDGSAGDLLSKGLD